MSAATPLSDTHKRPDITHKADPRTLDELAVLAASVEVREKENWRQDALNPEVMARWKTEATTKHRFSESMAQYFEDELKHEAGRWHDEARGIESTGIPSVVRSDKLVPDAVLDQLRTISNQLESRTHKDWHPESDKTILDVVHPSMYALIDNRTRVLAEDEAVQFPDDSRDLGRWFAKMPDVFPTDKKMQTAPSTQGAAGHDLHFTSQWLPADFQIDEAGKVKTLTYINNANPASNEPTGALYDVVESALESFVPMFEASLAECQLAGYRREFRKGNAQSHWIQESWNPAAPAEKSIDELASSEDDKQYLRSDGQSQWDKSANRIEAARKEYWTENREWVRIPVQSFEPQSVTPISLKGRKLQVIVRLSSVHLSKEKPEFEAGAWHVEGTHREKIVAVGTLVFDEENVENSKVGYRGAIDTAKAKADFPHEQHDFDAIMEFYGFGTDTETSQEYGFLSTKPGRSFAFSNGFQHQVPSFTLADKSKPGYRKVLSFLLVDPLQTVISTARVPPQQYSWMQLYYSRMIRSLPPQVPMEVRQMIMRYSAPAAIVPLPTEREEAGGDGQQLRKRLRLNSDREPSNGMTRSEAESCRMSLMRERAIQAVHIEEVNELGFTFFEP